MSTFKEWYENDCLFKQIETKIYRTINSGSGNLRIAPERYFRFHSDCKQARLQVRDRMPSCEIYFQHFSKITHTILQIFSQYGLM